MMFVCLTAL